MMLLQRDLIDWFVKAAHGELSIVVTPLIHGAEVMSSAEGEEQFEEILLHFDWSAFLASSSVQMRQDSVYIVTTTVCPQAQQPPQWPRN